MVKKKVTELVAEELAPFFEQEGYVLYHQEFVKEGIDWYLRVFIEKAPEKPGEWPQNVGTDDCEKVSRYLGHKLDELDPIKQNYYLEVSSPGMDRTLVKQKDFERYKDRLVDISLYESINGKKSITGKLKGRMEAFIDIEDEKGNLIRIPLEKVSKTKLTIVY